VATHTPPHPCYGCTLKRARAGRDIKFFLEKKIVGGAVTRVGVSFRHLCELMSLTTTTDRQQAPLTQNGYESGAIANFMKIYENIQISALVWPEGDAEMTPAGPVVGSKDRGSDQSRADGVPTGGIRAGKWSHPRDSKHLN
jgi:hypothetical protein